MPYKPLEDYISGLSDEEQTRFRELIDECLKRDELIEKNAARARENINRLIEQGGVISDAMTGLNASMNHLSREVLDLYLRVVPVERLFTPREKP